MIDDKEARAATKVWNHIEGELRAKGWIQDPEDPYWWSHDDRPGRHTTLAAYRILYGFRA